MVPPGWLRSSPGAGGGGSAHRLPLRGTQLFGAPDEVDQRGEDGGDFGAQGPATFVTDQPGPGWLVGCLFFHPSFGWKTWGFFGNMRYWKQDRWLVVWLTLVLVVRMG